VTITSSTLLTAIQYRCGAFLTALAPVLDEMTRRGVHVGQSDRLGDTAINEANATARSTALVAVVHNDLWLNTLDTVNAFDTANASTATVKRREAKRFISASQTGAGEFLRVASDDAIRGSPVAPAPIETIHRAGALPPMSGNTPRS